MWPSSTDSATTPPCSATTSLRPSPPGGPACTSRDSCSMASASPSSPSPAASNSPRGSPHRSRADPPAIRQPEPLGSPTRSQTLPRSPGPNLRQPRGPVPLRRCLLPQAGHTLRRRPAAVLRGVGQDGQRPGGRLRPRQPPARALPLDRRLYLPASWLADAGNATGSRYAGRRTRHRRRPAAWWCGADRPDTPGCAARSTSTARP